MEIRSIEPGDAQALRAFFNRTPEGDRTFIKEDVLDDAIVPAWVGEGGACRSVAVEDGKIVGCVSVMPGVGWSSHVGELRLLVDQAYRRKGLGRALARRGLLDALRLGLRKIAVEVVADQTAAVAMFQGLGFQAEALLRDYVRDHAGELRDLLLLAHSVDDRSSQMATLGIDLALKER
jgi:ribosomal protein S18 acetylase RimI-like enzyme